MLGKQRFFRSLISLVLILSLCTGITMPVCAANVPVTEVHLNPTGKYKNNHKFSMAVNDKNDILTRGTLTINGKIIDNKDNYCFSVETDSSVYFSYLKKDIKNWIVVDEPSKKVGSEKVGRSIGKGCILVKKSRDGNDWSEAPIYVKTNIFEDATGTVSRFFTAPRAEIKQGYFYRILVAYKQEQILNESHFLFIDTSKREYAYQVERYTVYLKAEEAPEDYVSPNANTDSTSDVGSIDVNITMPENDSAMDIGAAASGAVVGNQSTTNITAGEEIFHASQGHGFAAEAANMQAQAAAGNQVEHVGGNNVLNGADYIVTDSNGVVTEIQSKYYKTPSETIAACFDGEGNFRYYAQNGKPMQIEVPKDQYDKAVKEMAKRISAGKVEGVTDPAKASEIVRPGSYTYDQARNIAKAGNIESLTFDAKNSVVSAASAMGVSSTIAFARSIWEHDDIETALKKSVYTGLSVGGNAFVVSVLASQLSKAGLNSLLVPGSEAAIQVIGPKASAVIVNASRIGVTPIYGAAAMKSAAKMFRGNVITGTISLIIFTVPDMIKTFNGRISFKQLVKNTAVTATGIGAGFAGAGVGATAGAQLGTLILPGAGTAVGGAVGGIIGGVGSALAGTAGATVIANLIAEDDAEEMLKIISSEYEKLATDYLLNQEEVEQVTNILSMKLTLYELQDMHASKDREKYARNLLIPMIEEVISGRETIIIPEDDVLAQGVIDTLEDIYDDGLTEEQKKINN